MKSKMFKKTVLVDVDGVLNTYDGHYDKNIIPAKMESTEHFLSELQKDFRVVIFSTRDSEMVLDWLKNNSLDRYIDDITNVKVPAYLIIDDRCVQYNGNPQETLEQIKNYKPWWDER